MKTMSQVACLSDCPETMEEARALIRSLNEQVRKMRGPHDGVCFSCGKPTNSLHGNPSLWAMHFPHVDGCGTNRTYHIGCLYPLIRLLRSSKDSASFESVAHFTEKVVKRYENDDEVRIVCLAMAEAEKLLRACGIEITQP